MMKPLVSVVILTYNQEKTVARTLDCVMAQRVHFDFEVIIGEDASTDLTHAVCQSYVDTYPGIVKLMPIAPNKRLIKNYQDCLAQCCGEYICVCAGDDWWHNTDKLQRQTDYLNKHKECALVYTNYDILEVKTHRLRRNSLPHASFDTSNMVDKLLNGFFLPSLTIMYRRDLLQYIDFNKYIERGYRAEDLPMYLEFALHGTLDCLNISTATYSAQAGSLSNFDDAEKMESFMLNMRDIKRDFINEHPNESNTSIEQIEQVAYKTIFLVAFTIGKRHKALQYAKKIQTMSVIEKIKLLVCKSSLLFLLYLWLRKLLNK